MIHTGARRDEIKLLKWEHVDFGNKIIRLIRTKNKTDRALRMTKGMYELLKGLKETSNSEYCFTHEEDRVISVSMLQRRLVKFQKHYSHQKRWRCHNLRHSYAFHFLKKGGNMYQLQAILGHKTIGMTIDLYGQLKALDVVGIEVY